MRHPTDVFGEWAENGKDIGMEKGHTISIDEMISFAMEERTEIGKNFSFLDLGCGSGWVARKVAKENLCSRAVGIDGAAQMVARRTPRCESARKNLPNNMLDCPQCGVSRSPGAVPFSTAPGPRGSGMKLSGWLGRTPRGPPQRRGGRR